MIGGHSNNPSSPPPATALQIQTSAQGVPIAIGWGRNKVAGNVIWYGDFTAIPHQSDTGAGAGKGIGGGGGKGSSGNVTYTYQVAVQFGLGEGPISTIEQVWNNKTAQSLSSLNLTWSDGDYSQTAWSYLAAHHPEAALNYRGIAWAAAGPLDLGNSQELPNLAFEVQWAIGNGIATLPDADPKDVLNDFLTNVNYGVGFPSANMGDLSTYSNYCRAAGLLVSPLLQDQNPANQFVGDLMTATNSEIVWSGDKLTVVPYGDTALSANGATYNPPSAPLYSLTDDDYKAPQGGNPNSSAVDASSVDPVQGNIKRQSEAFNIVRVECLNRANAYNTALVEAPDEAEVNVFGARPKSTVQLHMICDPSIALTSAFLLLGREHILRTFTFTVGQEYIMLDPMDIVAITDTRLNLNEQWVRIKEITENQDGSLTMTVEEYLEGTGHAPVYGTEASAGFIPNYNVDPGDVNTPIVFGMPVALATNQGLMLGCAISGSNSNWGGCNIHVSSDGTTYKTVARQLGPSRMGVTTADFPIGTDPDTTHTLNVDLSESKGSLLSGTQNDADQGNTICLVGGANGIEYISYQDATLSSANNYALGTYLRRGQQGSKIVDHPSGSPFARVDSAIAQIPYDPTLIGKTIYLKFTSFNLWGGGEQDISAVTEYPIVVPAPPKPANVTGFAAKQNGNVVAFGWDAQTSAALQGYDIGYAPQGATDWSQFKMLTEAEAGTEMTNAEVPPGTWTFGIRARDIAEQLSPDITTLDLTVTASNPIIYDTPEETSWTGTLNGFVRHYTGVLIPENSLKPSDYSDSVDNGYTDIDNFVNDPVATCEYTTNAIDTGTDDNLRVFMLSSMVLGPGQSGTPEPALAIDTWLTGQTDPNTFVDWSIGYVKMRYLRERITYNPVAGQVAYLTDFTPSIDIASPVEQDINETIPAGGGIVTFPTPFHFPPSVVPTPVSASPLYATAVNVTATQCEIHVWNAVGTDVGGEVNIVVKGE